MHNLTEQLELERCPHCQVDKPSLCKRSAIKTSNHLGLNHRVWKIYDCSRCGGVILASAEKDGGPVKEMYPPSLSIDESIPNPARSYLQQAIDSLHAPAGSVMLCASSVDAMLKAKGHKKGTLNERINKAAADHLITQDMAKWAHEVRLDANDPRHADEVNPLPTDVGAQRSVEFALALGDFLFVMPSKVMRGLEDAEKVEDDG